MKAAGGRRRYSNPTGYWGGRSDTGRYIGSPLQSGAPSKSYDTAEFARMDPRYTAIGSSVVATHLPRPPSVTADEHAYAGKIPQSSDFFRYTDTRLRRLESGEMLNSRVRLTGPRLALKGVLDSIGRADFVYPFIADDGAGGCFAEWKAGPQRIEISIEADGDGSVSISTAGKVETWVEFNSELGVSADLVAAIRPRLQSHSSYVKALNPNWLRFFVNG